jgi:hypothetical protein
MLPLPESSSQTARPTQQSRLGVGDLHAVHDRQLPGPVVRVEYLGQLCPAAVTIIRKEPARAPKVRAGAKGDRMALGVKLFRDGNDDWTKMTVQLPVRDKDKANRYASCRPSLYDRRPDTA